MGRWATGTVCLPQAAGCAWWHRKHVLRRREPAGPGAPPGCHLL